MFKKADWAVGHEVLQKDLNESSLSFSRSEEEEEEEEEETGANLKPLLPKGVR